LAVIQTKKPENRGPCPTVNIILEAESSLNTGMECPVDLPANTEKAPENGFVTRSLGLRTLIIA